MKDIIRAIKAFFQFRKIIKKEGMKIESIQKMWILIGSILGTLSFTWMPGWLPDLFGPEGTQLVFAAANAVIALVQFLPFRTGETEKEAAILASPAGSVPAQLKVEKESSVRALYAVIPFWPAGKAA